MNRLEQEYQSRDTAEERRIMMAIIAAGAIIGLLISVALNIALIYQLSNIPQP